MSAPSFISSRLRFQGRISVWATAISFVIIIISLSVSGGFRKEIRRALAGSIGDVTLTSVRGSSISGTDSIPAAPACLDELMAVPGVARIRPVVCRAGVVKGKDDIYGVVVKGIEDPGREPLTADIPSKMARELKLGVGDRFPAYFVGERVKARRFTVRSIYEGLLDTNESPVIYTGIDDVRRLNGWGEGSAGALEVSLDDGSLTRKRLNDAARELGAVAMIYNGEDDVPLTAVSSAEKYGQIFDWLELIDFNVAAILILMIAVAGVNMISGLLIMLLRNVRTIGQLKTMGMKNRGIAAVFIRLASRAVFKGMLAGNLIALGICLIQKYTHLLKLNPANYFLSFVPMDINPALILATDAIAFAAICVLLTIPTLFIAGVDPAKTVSAS